MLSENSKKPELGSLIAASFCCGAGIVRSLLSRLCNGFDLVSWDLEFPSADPNNGEVPNEKAKGADEAVARSKTLFGFEGTAASLEVGVFSETAFVVGNVVDGCPNVVFLSIAGGNDEGPGLLLFLLDSEPNWGEGKVAFGDSLVPKALGVSLDSLALPPFSSGMKLNFGGSFLSNGL